MGSVPQQPLHIVESRPDALFQVDRVAVNEDVLSSSMPAGRWLDNTSGQPTAGVLGVLVDNVLGYAIMLGRPMNHWSVSSEISIDLCHRIAPDTTRLFGEARLEHSDTGGGVSSGQIVDDRGRLVALCRQHGRFVPTVPPKTPPRAEGGAVPSREPLDVLDLLNSKATATAGGAEMELATTPELVNPLGNLHGGITLCASDVAGTAAASASGRLLTTTSIHIAYLRPAPAGTRVRFEASVVYAGRTFAVIHVSATNEEGKVCTMATVTAGPR